MVRINDGTITLLDAPTNDDEDVAAANPRKPLLLLLFLFL